MPEGEKLLTDELKINTTALDYVKASSKIYIDSILKVLNYEIDEKHCCDILTDRYITPEVAYMFIDGHYLKDNVIKPMLDLLKRKNKNEDINEIKEKLPRERWKQSIQEVNNYFRDCCHTECIIHNTTSYSSGEVWELIKGKLNNVSNMV
ncbi:hypothetical protein N6Y36_03875 [Morganella morganii]|nr:hypothetical protein N6Y36_03875 [Morganella morganii]